MGESEVDDTIVMVRLMIYELECQLDEITSRLEALRTLQARYEEDECTSE